MGQFFSETQPNFYEKKYLEPNLGIYLPAIKPRASTIEALSLYGFKDQAGRFILWTPGQLEIIDCILNRSSQDAKKRIQIIASTQYGKSLAVAAGVVIRASCFAEKWAIVAGTDEKAKIIMEYIILFSLQSPIIRQELVPDTPLDRLRMKRSADQLVYRLGGAVRVYSANATKVSETSTALMGFGAQNVVEDESALIGDILQATVMRMLGGFKDNLLIKIGNPFNRNHFLRTWESGLYHRIFIDYNRAIDEGRYSKEYLEEMKKEALFDILYECKFPPPGRMDIRGWIPLLSVEDVKRSFSDDQVPFGKLKLGNDVAGGGRNYSVSVMRGYNMAKKLYKEHEPDTMVYAGEIVKMVQKDHINYKEDVYTDGVGVGKGCTDRLRQLFGVSTAISAGEEPADKKRFFNKRAEMYWRLRSWLLQGGKLERDEDWLQLSLIKYKVVDGSGKIQIMSKEAMLKEGVDSPDVADALSLTFYATDSMAVTEEESLDWAPEEVTVSDIDPFGR